MFHFIRIPFLDQRFDPTLKWSPKELRWAGPGSQPGPLSQEALIKPLAGPTRSVSPTQAAPRQSASAKDPGVAAPLLHSLHPALLLSLSPPLSRFFFHHWVSQFRNGVWGVAVVFLSPLPPPSPLHASPLQAFSFVFFFEMLFGTQSGTHIQVTRAPPPCSFLWAARLTTILYLIKWYW